uniref:Kinesin motor domain-containing protein n=1 Tax=Esox lucius TaxID=8010 RepID=A0A6Q2X000_ESOLU
TRTDSIKVFVRVRPLTKGTGLTTDGDKGQCLTVTSTNTILLNSKPEPRPFIYDHVADMETSQDSVFSIVAKNIVESCVNGYNGTIFAYGQTGSGKTFTMLGPSDSDNFTDDLRGVIPRSFEYLFYLINREVERSGNTKSFLCKCSFIEIYNEQIYDLLDSASASLFLRENIKKGVFVEGAVEKFVTSAAEAYQVLSMGWRNRRVASTSMNRESSRSHAVFTMTLESKETAKEVVNIRMSQLNLVDLAGSERQRDTHTEGTRLKEASSINLSLMCLGQVIMALVDVSNGKSRHICYRDSKLTFLLRDSLGGNAKTYIIANVHPGSKCFGETLSTLQFAQRAKLIKNKAMINEDTQGNVRQLQAEVKKLKELLAQALSAQTHNGDVAPGGPQIPTGKIDIQTKFLQAVRLWKKRENDKQVWLSKVAQLEEAWAQKEKFIHSNRMILKFREEHISRLEKSLKDGQVLLSDPQSQTPVDKLKEEIKILRDQIEHHPKMTRYAAENYSLREENRQLRSLESVRRAEQAACQAAAELEEEFQRVLETERSDEIQTSYSTPVTAENISAISMERLKAQFLQKQTELTATIQAFEEYKELTKKQMSELESEKRYLNKSNKHLESILEATKAHKKQEVSQLNKIHFETIKILTTPTKAYNLRTRLVPLSSPEHLNQNQGEDEDMDDIRSEQPPPEMTEMACVALTEELQLVQVQQTGFTTSGVLVAVPYKLCHLINMAKSLALIITFLLQKGLSFSWTCVKLLRSEVHDLRLVLQSSDRELAAVKKELSDAHGEEKEISHLSSSLISTQLQLQEVRREWEQLLEEQRSLQDAFDQLQAEAKFDADQSRQWLEEKQQEITAQQAHIKELTNALQSEREHITNLTSQLKEDKESTLEELVQTMEQNVVLRKEVSDLNNQNKQQVCHSLLVYTRLGVVLELINQTRDLRSELAQKVQGLAMLSGDVKDLTAKYSAACSEREEIKEHNLRMEAELQDLREIAERKVASNLIEVEVLQEEVAYATEEVERLTKVLDEQAGLLQASFLLFTHGISVPAFHQLKQQHEAVERTVRERFANLTDFFQTPRTPMSFNNDLNKVLESQERELESRRCSMITMEVLLSELSAERAAKNEEIQRLKAQLTEKEIVRIEIQSLLDQFYTKQNQLAQNGNANELVLHQNVLRELQEERTFVVFLVLIRLHGQESVLAQSQTHVQKLTDELRNRCLELRELNQNNVSLQEVEVLRKQVDHLSEENGKLVGHKNHKQRIEYLVKLKKENTKLQEENEKLRSEMSLRE